MVDILFYLKSGYGLGFNTRTVHALRLILPPGTPHPRAAFLFIFWSVSFASYLSGIYLSK